MKELQWYACPQGHAFGEHLRINGAVACPHCRELDHKVETDLHKISREEAMSMILPWRIDERAS